MTDKEIKEFVKERDNALRTHDVQMFREFYTRWERKGVYRLELPQSDLIIRASMEKGILAMASATEQEKEDARLWLVENGFKPEC